MKVSIEIKDEKQKELVEKLRGDKTAKEFVTLCAEAGLKMLAEQQGKVLRFTKAKPEFIGLDVAAVTDALKANDPKNPVTIEVSRLVNAYASELKGYADRNNNTLPKKLRVDAKAPIEKVAFQITAQAINMATKDARKEKAAKNGTA